MIPQNFSISIILTYKNKFLLLSPDVHPAKNQKTNWSILGGQMQQHESYKDSIRNKVQYVTKLVLKDLKPLSLSEENVNTCYHGKLTDTEVNSIQRRVGQRLEFYTLEEIKHLSLTPLTSNFFLQNQTLVQQLIAE